ncbi:MAG: HAMP domain-containing protein [Candidatus Competibacteraceae bacterium]|nr:HAMP domain-containing protein [Candidatus Competibacteraceae bacterium]
MNFLEHLSPRRHLAATIGWSVFAIVLVAALVGANLAARQAAERARADTERLLDQFATQIRFALDMSLATRQSILEATAAQMSADGAYAANTLRQRRHLDVVREEFPEFIWLGATDERGLLVMATDGLLQGETAASCPWFQQGRRSPFLGDARQTPLLDTAPPSELEARSSSFVIAVPLRRSSDAPGGVLVAKLSWKWIEGQESELLRQLDTTRTLELLVATADRWVVLGPPHWRGRILAADADATEAGNYVIGQNAVRSPRREDLGWTVILRQDADTALARARLAYRTVFSVVLLAGLLSAVAAVFVTRDLTSRLRVLADQAQAVRQGAQERLEVPTGTDEIGRIGTALGDLVDHLQREKRALAGLNAELDARVAERTARIERLAEEARHAAIARERLRLARELHDTLAHSLMALLTQIRLIRKLRDRLGPEDLNEELAQAEEVAASGLAEARAAITQMRHNSVRDEGLGAALQPLLNRFRQRSGVDAALHADTQAAGLADERAETVFRIVEEALKNVERHANANTVHVNLRWLESAPLEWPNWNPEEPARVRLEIIDDGIGFDPAAPRPGHYGLRGIREQAELIRARFELHSQPYAGARIVLEFDA